jgi:hypothetical protein
MAASPCPSAPADTRLSTPAPPVSVDPWLSPAARTSAPASGRTQRQSSVQTYPGLHGALDAQTSQSRLRQESPNIAGRRSASPLEHTTLRLFMSGFSAVGRISCVDNEERWRQATHSLGLLTNRAIGRYWARLARRAPCPCADKIGRPRGRRCPGRLDVSSGDWPKRVLPF